MELRKIHYFLRIVDKGSLSKAAQSLYLTQPTMSRFLDKLEEDVGVKLFTRRKDSALTLTEAGQKYLHAARQIDALWQALDLDLAINRVSNHEEQILFGIYGDHLQSFATACAEAVMEKYPGISVNFICDGSLEIQRQVVDGTLNLGLAAFAEKDPNLAYSLCGKAEMNLVVSNDHPLAEKAYALPGQQDLRINIHQLDSNAQFALMRDRTVLRETVQDYLLRQKYTPNVKQTYMRHGSIVSILTGNRSLIGFSPANNTSSKLAYIALDPPFYYCQAICCLKEKQLTPAEKMLVKLLKKQPTTRLLD